MGIRRPYVLTIAGFDPSGGAGILADTKTFESIKAQGLAVVSALTYQTEDQFTGVDWVPMESMIRQADLLLKKYPVEVVKIGLIQDLSVMGQMLDLILENHPKTRIVWDPILKASAGFSFHKHWDQAIIEKLCSKLFMITPNWNEMKMMFPEMDPIEAGAKLALNCHVFLKGGHREDQPGRDQLFTEKNTYTFKPRTISSVGKHGSGCVLSAAIAAHVARGFPLLKSCLRSKNYVTRFLLSNQTLLGYHP